MPGGQIRLSGNFHYLFVVIDLMHILFLSDNFPPEVNAPASRTFEHCREWVKDGHKVTVITCAPNFPQGKVYNGYRNKLWQVEVMEGIKVIRVWTYITANEGFVKRIIDYLSFMATAILAAPFVRKPNIVIGTSPQFFTVCAAYVISRMKRIPFVFELRDLWPESIKAVGAMRESFLIRLLEKLALFLYRKADSIISVTESYRNILILRGIPAEKIEVVTNGVDMSLFKPMAKDSELLDRYGLRGKFVTGYIGTHGMAHALETVLETADYLRRNDMDDFRFLFLGDGACKKKLIEKAREMGLSNVVFVDSVRKEEVAKYWALLDVSIIHLRKADLFTTVIPSKIFESMGMGIPMLLGVEGESASIVTGENAGLLFEPENATELCESLLRLHRDVSLFESLRVNCLAAIHNYDRCELAKKMLGIIEEVSRVGAARHKFTREAKL